jgi:hypothetical protein
MLVIDGKYSNEDGMYTEKNVQRIVTNKRQSSGGIALLYAQGAQERD